jgi:hypothetical protein
VKIDTFLLERWMSRHETHVKFDIAESGILPLSAAEMRRDHVEAASPLVLLDLRPDSFYRREARPLSALRGTAVDGERRLQDVVLGPDWRIVELVLEDGERVPLDGLVLPGLRSR